jgi:hypothetical protein
MRIKSILLKLLVVSAGLLMDGLLRIFRSPAGPRRAHGLKERPSALFLISFISKDLIKRIFSLCLFSPSQTISLAIHLYGSIYECNVPLVKVEKRSYQSLKEDKDASIESDGFLS